MSLKDIKLNFIVDVATDLFITQGIEKVTIKDIAVKAGVGEATIYRYFGKKQAIVVQSVLKLQNIVNTSYFNLGAGKTGFEKLSIFYNSYVEVFEKRPEFFFFLREFDLYMLGEDSSLLDEYEDVLGAYKNIYLESYKLGLEDGSIKKVEDIELFYYATTHALIEICKKLSTGLALLKQDKNIQKSDEIKCLIASFLNMVKNS